MEIHALVYRAATRRPLTLRNSLGKVSLKKRAQRLAFRGTSQYQAYGLAARRVVLARAHSPGHTAGMSQEHNDYGEFQRGGEPLEPDEEALFQIRQHRLVLWSTVGCASAVVVAFVVIVALIASF